MKKVLSFCVLSMLLAVLSMGLKAQSGLVLDPANMPAVVLDQYDTINISTDPACFGALGLTGDDKISIEWQVLYNGSVIPDDSLSYYFKEFKFESRYDAGANQTWYGDPYTSGYCNNGNGHGSYPGANTPVHNTELGQACEDPGHFWIGNRSFQFDYFYVGWFTNTAITAHRLVYNIKVDGDYQFVFSIAQRLNGTKWDFATNQNYERYYVGGHMSELGDTLSSDTLRTTVVSDITDYYRCVGDSLVLGNPAVTFKVSTDTTVDPGYDSVFYMGPSSCSSAIDSIVRFRVFFEDPSVPVLDTLNSTLVLCDSGQISISVTTTAADKCIWLDETLAVLDTLDAATAFTKNINANAQFHVLGFNSASGCISSDTLTVYAEVFSSPNPVVSAVDDSICENGALKISLDKEYDAWTWFHDGTDMNLDTIVYDVADAAIADAGQYWAVVSENHVHSVYPTIDTIACSASDTVQIVVFERPSVAWATFDGNAVVDSMTLCPNDLEHVLVATISGGQAPYDNIQWTGIQGMETYNADKSSDTLSITLANTCGAEYTAGIDYAIDFNGCTLKDTINVTFFVNDTVKPTVAKTKDTTSLQNYQTKNCEYIIPDVMAIITTSDNCGLADTTQVPAAGDIVTTDTIVIVTVTDLCGNTASDTIEVRLPVDELAIDTIEVTATVLCAGDANGAIRVTVEAGTGTAPYDVTITHHTVANTSYSKHGTIDQTIFDFDGLIAGKWDIEVTDSNGCQVIVNDTADVAAPDILTLTTSDWTDLTCFESNDGSFKFNVKQGTTPYEVKIVRKLGAEADSVEMTLNPSVLDTTITMENQKAGAYAIYVVDGHGCTATANDTIIQPDQLVLVGDTVLNHVKCFGDSNGNLAVTEVTGGTYPYYYAWVNEANDTVSTDSVTGRILPAGIYTIYITDANNCTPNQVLTDTIKQPEKALNVVSVNAPVSDTCPRLRTYTFDATVEGGRPDYEFEWTFNDNMVSQPHSNAGAVADTFVYYENTISCDTTFEIIFKVTDDSACVAMDTIYFTIADTIAPTLSGLLDTLYIDGCAAGDAGDTLSTIAKLQNAGLTISDNCTAVDALTVNYSEVVSGTCPIEVVRTYSVTDSCGLTSDEVKHVIYVQDTTAPTFDRPVDTILYLSDACTVDTTAAIVGLPTNLDDNCTPVADLVVSHRDEVVAGCGSTYTISRYWKVVDACGNVSNNADSIQTIQVQDTTPPTFTKLPVSRTYPCDGSGNTVLLNNYKNTKAGAVAIDNCSLESLTMNEDSVVTGCNSATLTYYFSFTATDVCNNSTTVYATFSIIDTVPPTVYPADDITMECSIDDLNTILENSLANFTYDDACSHHAVISSTSLSDFNKACGSTGYYTHYVTVTDSCQTTTASHRINIVDNTPPEFTVVPSKNSSVECNGMGNLDTLFNWLHSAKAVDACSGVIDSIAIYYENASGVSVPFDSLAAVSNLDAFGHIIDAWKPVHGNCDGYYRFVWEAVDSCGNINSATEDFYINDNKGPVFTQIRTNDTVECGFNHDDFITWLKVDSALDVCTGTKYAVTFDTVFYNACGNTGYYRVKWSVADTCGNATDPVYANWVVIDTTPPVITTSNSGNNLVNDTIYRPSNPDFSVSTPSEHFVMLDSYNASVDFINALLNGDSIEDVNSDKFVIHNAAGIISIDECGWLKSFHYNPVGPDPQLKNCSEEWNIEFTFTDACDSAIYLHQSLFILDTSAPVHNDIEDVRYFDVACAPEVVEEFTTIEQANAYVAYSLTGSANSAGISDYLPGTIQLDSVRPGVKVSGHPCDSVEVRYYTISDQCGNSTVFTHTIYFRDTIAPVISQTELVDSIHVKSDCSTYTEIADENYNTNMLDKAWVESHFNITIQDCHDVTIAQDGADVHETDINYCPGDVIVRKYKVTDNCDQDQHSSSFTLKLVVMDTIAPTVIPGAEILPADTAYLKEDCTFDVPDHNFANYAAMKAWNGGADVYNDCYLSDNGAVNVFGPFYGGAGCDSTVTYKYTVADSCGNMSRDTVTLVIHVLDTLAPTALVTTLPDTTVYSLADCSYTLPSVLFNDYEELVDWNKGADVYSDCNLGLTNNVTVFGPFGSGTACDTIFTYKYVVADSCGNVSKDTVSLSIHVLDTVAPVALPNPLPEDTVYSLADCSYTLTDVQFVSYSQLVAWNNGSDVYTDCNLGQTGNVQYFGPFGSGTACDTIFTYKYVVTDLCGNESKDTLSISIHVLDTVAPALVSSSTLPADTVYSQADGTFTLTDVQFNDYDELVAWNGSDVYSDCHLGQAGNVTVIGPVASGTTCDTIFTYKYVVTDLCGNEAHDTVSISIHVLDTVSPWLDVTLPDYDAERTATACQFLVPDLHDTIAAHYVDNWSAFTAYDQIPAAGYAITDFRDTVVMVAYGDACGNMDTVYVNINVPDSLKITSVSMTKPLCHGDKNGTITVEIEGGTPDYIYSCGVTNDTISAMSNLFDTLVAAFYNITVTDANGCTAQDTITVTEPEQLTIAAAYTLIGDICANDTTNISITVTQGTPDYTILATLLDGSKVVTDTIYFGTADNYGEDLPLDAGDHYVAFYVVDNNGCTETDTSALISVHPTYYIEQTARVCHSDIVAAGGYTWVDENGETRKGGMIDASIFSVPDSIYTLYDSLQTAGYLCDSIYVLQLNVTDKPYLKVRPLPTVYTPNISDAVEEIPVRNFTTDSVNVGWEIFVDKNCMNDACKNPQLKVSLDYELYRFDPVDSVYVLMPDVSIYFKPEYRTFLDIYGMNYMPSSSSHVSCPSVYQNSGFNQEFDYYYLCWLDPEYNTGSNLFPSNSTLMSNGWYYQDGRANTIRITEFLVGGDYKIKVTLNKRDGGTHWGHTTVPMTGGGYPGGYDGSYVVEPYASAEILFHVDGPSMPTPQPIAPIGGSVIYSSNNDDPQTNVYPNPARDFITIEITGFEGQTNVMLSNTDGKNLRNIELDIDDVHTTSIVKIETGNYAQGIYLVTVRNNDAIVTKRVVIIR